MKLEKGGAGKNPASEQPILTEITLSDLRDYKAEMEESNKKAKLLDKEQQAQEKKKRGRDWRGGYLMAMVILNANNASVIALQKERDDWFLAFQNRGEVLENSEAMTTLQKQLSEKGMERENKLRAEHTMKVAQYIEVLTLFKKYPDALLKMTAENATAEDIVLEFDRIFEENKNYKENKKKAIIVKSN